MRITWKASGEMVAGMRRLETGILWMMVSQSLGAGGCCGHTMRGWAGLGGTIQELLISRPCTQSIFQLVVCDLEDTYPPGRALGTASSLEGFDGVDCQPARVGLAHL